MAVPFSFVCSTPVRSMATSVQQKMSRSVCFFCFFVFYFAIRFCLSQGNDSEFATSARAQKKTNKQTNKQKTSEEKEKERRATAKRFRDAIFCGRRPRRPPLSHRLDDQDFSFFLLKKQTKIGQRLFPTGGGGLCTRRGDIVPCQRRRRVERKRKQKKKNPEFLSTCRFYERHRASLLLLLFFYSLLYGSLIGFLYRHAPVAEFFNQFHSVVLDWPMRTEEKKKKKERRFTAARLYFSAFAFTRPRPPGWSSCQTWRTAASWGPASPLWSWRSRLRSWQCPCRLGSWPPPAAPVWPEQRGERKKNRRLVHFLRGGLPDEVEATQTLASSSPRWAKTSPMTKGTGADSSSTMRRSSEASSRFWRSLCASVGGCGH